MKQKCIAELGQSDLRSVYKSDFALLRIIPENMNGFWSDLVRMVLK